LTGQFFYVIMNYGDNPGRNSTLKLMNNERGYMMSKEFEAPAILKLYVKPDCEAFISRVGFPTDAEASEFAAHWMKDGHSVSWVKCGQSGPSVQTNKTMMELAASLVNQDDHEEPKCIICGTLHPEVALVTGPNAWLIIPHSVLGYASVCPDCNDGSFRTEVGSR
jgi:hypothetical protein